MNWWSYATKSKKVSWTRHPISEPKAKGVGMFSHGLGWGDINGDGIKDVMIIGGWWEAPKDMKATSWKFHETNLGYACSQMLPFDFDNDGDTDVISGSAHNYGLWWHEQVRDNGNISFVRHVIDSTFSELHSMVLKDVNNDGLPDLITGKRFFSHQGHGPGGMEDAVVYWFELLKDGKGNQFGCAISSTTTLVLGSTSKRRISMGMVYSTLQSGIKMVCITLSR